MALNIKVETGLFGNWRFVEVDNKGKVVQKGPKHVKGTLAEKDTITRLITQASSIEELEVLLSNHNFKSESTKETLAKIENMLNDPKIMKELIETKTFDAKLKEILRNKFDGQTIGQMMDEKEFAAFLSGVLDKMMSYTTSLFEYTQTDEDRAELSAVTEYLISSTAGSIMMVEKETFRKANKALITAYNRSDKEFREQFELLGKNQKTIDELIADNAQLDADIEAAEASLAEVRSKFDSQMKALAGDQVESREDLSRRTESNETMTAAYRKKTSHQENVISRLLARKNAQQSKKAAAESQVRGLGQE